MSPTIVHARPPMWDDIVTVFPRARNPGVIFSWGRDTIFYPSPTGTISPSLLAHEAVHGDRQDKMGSPAWWEQYLDDPQFRLDEEILAHRAEYQWFVLAGAGRPMRRSALAGISQRLSGPLYGRMISSAAAKRLVAQ